MISPVPKSQEHLHLLTIHTVQGEDTDAIVCGPSLKPSVHTHAHFHLPLLNQGPVVGVGQTFRLQWLAKTNGLRIRSDVSP